LGVFACQGNHDVDRLSLREGAATDRVREFLEKSGIVFLFDEVVLVADRFYLAGRRDARPIGGADPSNRRERKTAAELTAGLDLSRPLIVMDHQPVDYPSVEAAGADLILSGHTHRGQFFPGNVITARMFRKAGAVDYGYWQGRSAQGVVSSGAGVWGPPIRIGTFSEVAAVDINFIE
jgi:predicted MPP superfamily phosphohydrolase